jgi:hypothetical protein
MPGGDYPRLVFEHGFDERAQFEASGGGYVRDVRVALADGTSRPVVFYDPVRLSQDLEYEAQIGRMCIAEHGMIVVPEVTLANMQTAVIALAREGWFDARW